MVGRYQDLRFIEFGRSHSFTTYKAERYSATEMCAMMTTVIHKI